METQESPPRCSLSQKNRLRSFPHSARLVAAFLGCRGSGLELAVLCSWTLGLSTPWGLGRVVRLLKTKRLLPGAAQLRKTVRELGRSIHSLARLVLAFLGCRPFLRGWWCLVLLCGSVAPPKGKQACAGTASAVVGFRQLLRPALLDGRQPQVW